MSKSFDLEAALNSILDEINIKKQELEEIQNKYQNDITELEIQYLHIVANEPNISFANNRYIHEIIKKKVFNNINNDINDGQHYHEVFKNHINRYNKSTVYFFTVGATHCGFSIRNFYNNSLEIVYYHSIYNNREWYYPIPENTDSNDIIEDILNINNKELHNYFDNIQFDENFEYKDDILYLIKEFSKEIIKFQVHNYLK